MSLDLVDITNYYSELKIRGKPKAIIGNEKARLFQSLIYPLRKQSIIIGGEAGSAKSCLLKGMAIMVWGDDVLEDKVPEVIVISAMSGKGLLTQEMEERINADAQYVIAPELQNWVRGNNDNNEDLIKAWGEGEPYIYARNDITTNSTIKLCLRAQAIATSVANENPRLKDLGEELERRLLNVWTESSVDLNRRVKKRKAECAAFPDELIYKGGLAKARDIKEVYQDIMVKGYGVGDNLLTTKMKNPGAVYMADAIPSKFTISNTLVDAWHELVYAVTQFYNEDRLMDGDKPFNKKMLSTPADNYMAWVIGGEIFTFASLRVKDIGKILLDLMPLNTFSGGMGLRTSSDGKETITLDEIVDLLQLKGIERSKSQVKETVNKMVMATYIKSDGKDAYWKTRDYSGEFTHAIDWRAMSEACVAVAKEHYPGIAHDYIRLHCEDPVCRHPITGEKIRLFDIDPEVEVKKGKAGTRKAINLGVL
jgi:hypothetical protein